MQVLEVYFGVRQMQRICCCTFAFAKHAKLSIFFEELLLIDYTICGHVLIHALHSA